MNKLVAIILTIFSIILVFALSRIIWILIVQNDIDSKIITNIKNKIHELELCWIWWCKDLTDEEIELIIEGRKIMKEYKFR